jgi:hypothetical protein
MICVHGFRTRRIVSALQSIGSSNRIRAGGLHGQSLDHPHASATAWAPRRLEGRANRLHDLASMGAIRHLPGGSQSATLRELGSPMCVGEQAIVADTTKTSGKNMKKKPTNEFCDLKSHDTAVVTLLPLMILPEEGDVRVVQINKTAVRDGLSVPCQIGQDRPRPPAGLLAVNDPFRHAEGLKSARKHPGIIEFEEISKKPQLTRLKS